MWPFDGNSFTDELKVDQAILNVTSTLSKSVWLYQLSDECVECPFKKLRKIPARSYVVEKINTATNLKWSIYNTNVGPYAYPNSTAVCSVDSLNLGQFGVYNLTISDDDCSFHTFSPPINANLPFLWLFLIVLFICGLSKISQRIFQRYFIASTTTSTSHLDSDNEVQSNQQVQPVKSTPNRLHSLDTFRGLAIVTMIFANNGCGEYHWLEHASWNGIHPADFIFPSFLWIMGVCIPISMKSQFAKNIPTKDLLSNIFIRSLKLFFIGLFIHTAHGPSFSAIRIMGVLQRFGIAYLVIASLYVLFYKENVINSQNNETQRTGLIDITSLLPQWFIMLIITSIHLLVIFYLPIPNCGSGGYFGPGGINKMSKFTDCIGGATGYVDRLIIGKSHLYQRPRAASIYDEKQPFDPEGAFGCLLTIVHVFFGVQCGQSLLLFKEPEQRIKRWLSWSFVTFLLGGSLCRFSINDGLIPINKNLWSLSYVLVTTAFSYLLLTIFYIVIDLRKYWSGKPLLYAGMNAILMYIGSELFSKMYPFYWHFDWMNTHFSYLLANVWNAAMWNFIAYYLYRRKIFFSL